MNTVNKHDLRRKQQLIGAIEAVLERAETYRLYLTAGNEPDSEAIADANLVMEHIDIALEHLSKAVPAT